MVVLWQYHPSIMTRSSSRNSNTKRPKWVRKRPRSVSLSSSQCHAGHRDGDANGTDYKDDDCTRSDRCCWCFPTSASNFHTKHIHIHHNNIGGHHSRIPTVCRCNPQYISTSVHDYSDDSYPTTTIIHDDTSIQHLPDGKTSRQRAFTFPLLQLLRQQQKPRLQHTFRPSQIFQMMVAGLYIFSALMCMVDGSSPTYSLCYTELIRADTNGDQIIAIPSEEWGLVVQYISGGTSTSDAIDTATILTAAGSTDAVTFSIVTVQDPTNQHSFCQALYRAIIAASSVALDVTESKCFYAATIGDAYRDSALERYSEFPRYANQVSGNSYGFGITYEELPLVVQSMFDEFVDDTTAGTINIVGSKSSETVTTEQATKLNALCHSVAVAILAATHGGGNSNVVPTPVTTTTTTISPVSVVPTTTAPIVAPTTAVTAAPVSNSNVNVPDNYVESYSMTDCLLKIAFSDGTRDNTLNSDEYYEFLNRITDDAFVEHPTFDALPEILRNNFITLAGGTADGTINVLGSKPGQTPTQEDTDRLSQFCKLTDVAIQGAAGGSSSPPPVTAPVTDTGDNVPGVSSVIPYDDCVKSMIIADISRNSLLDGKEYVRFISRLDTNVKPTDDISVLSISIQKLFTTLASSNGEIDVTGSKPNETPTPEQKIHLESICSQVGTALSESGNELNTPPSSSSVTINNAFVTANAMQITAAMLVPGKPEWEGLSKAYTSFIETVVLDLTKPTRRTSENIRRKRRHLIVTGIAKNSPQLGQITDTPCPLNMSRTDVLCQVVFASFVAEFSGTDETTVLATLTNNSQAQIYPRLNDTLFAVNPGTAIYIVGPSDIVFVDNSTLKPPKPGVIEEGDSDGANVVQIIGALVIIGILLGGPIYYWKTRRRPTKKNNSDDVKNDILHIADDEEIGIESAPTLHAKLTSTDDEDSEEDDPGNDDDESSANDDDAPTKNDQNGKVGGKKFNAFRLGKKRDSSSDDDIGILESNDGLIPGTDDFDNYEFDEPSELFVHHNNDSIWADSNWGTATTAVTTSNNNGFVGDDFGPKHDGNEHTEWSHSQSSESNSVFETSSVVSGASGDNVAQLGGLVDKGQWGGVLQTAAQFHNNLNDSVSSRNSDHHSFTSNKSETETSRCDDNPAEIADDQTEDRTLMTNVSVTSEELRRTEMYRLQIEDLVRKTAPDEIGNVKSMMEKFVGREAELINTLQTMHERLVSQRALKAVHKSKAIRARDVRDFASGGAESSAVIAAACMINNEEDTIDYNNQDDFEYGGEDSYYEGDDPEESASGSRSYDNDDNATYNDDDQSRSGTYDEDDGRSGMYDDDYDDDSHSGRYDDDNYDDEDHSVTGSYDGQGDSRGASVVDDDDYDDNDRSQYSYDDKDEEDYSRASEYDDEEHDKFDKFGSPMKRGDDYDDDEDDAFRDEGERFDDEEFDDDFIGSGSGSHTGSYDLREGSAIASHSVVSHSGSGSKSQSHSFVYDDGDGSYYSDDEQE